MGQVDKRIKDAIMGNIGTLLCLRVGIDDAQVLQKELGRFSTEDLLNLRVGQAIVRMGSAQGSFNLQIPLLHKPEDDYTDEILKLAQQKKTTAPAINNSSKPPITTVSPILPTPSPHPQPTSANLLPEEKQFLEFIYQSTELLPLSELRQQLSLGAKTIYKQINILLNKGLLTESQLRLSATGRKSRVIIITSEGINALGYPSLQGKGGALHQYLQRIVKSYAETKGYKVSIEHPLEEQKSVDLHLEKDNKKTAVEISITTDANQELTNIQKCLDAGYERIIVCCASEQTRRSLEKLANRSFKAKIKARIFIPSVTGLFQLI